MVELLTDGHHQGSPELNYAHPGCAYAHDGIEYACTVAEKGQSLISLQPDGKGNLLRVVAENSAVNTLPLVEQHFQQVVGRCKNNDCRQDNLQKIEEKLHVKGYLSKGRQRYALHS